MRSWNLRVLVAAAGALTVAACGGGGGDVNSTPFVRTPPPPPPPTPPVAASESLEFDKVGDDVRIRWNGDADAYEVMLPGSDWAEINPETYDYAVRDSDGTQTATAYFRGAGLYSYTGLAFVYDDESSYTIAYGTATPASGVPVTGSASYAAELWDLNQGYGVGGEAQFDFDFAAGTLAGYVDAIAADGWGPWPLGRYDFVDTVYSTGSTTFSGGLLNSTNSLGGSFSGLFTGPLAQELMGQWQLQYTDPYAADVTLSASGVFVGKANP